MVALKVERPWQVLAMEPAVGKRRNIQPLPLLAVMASNLIAMASNLLAMASNLKLGQDLLGSNTF